MQPHEVDWGILDAEVNQDILHTNLRQRILAREEVLKGLVEQGQLIYKGSYVLPKTSSFIKALLKKHHDSPLGGHVGESKTYSRIAADWFWEGIKK